jgi:hypothetical protein
MFYKQLPDQTRNEKVDFFAHEKHAHCYTKSYFVGKKSGAHSQSYQCCFIFVKKVFRPLRGAFFRHYNIAFFVTSLPE